MGTASDTLYASLARGLQNAIFHGVHGPGSLLPGEKELADEHGVSRATVRAALDLLERQGIVERRRGARTRVRAPRPPGGFGQSVLSIEGLIQYARDTQRVVLSTRTVVLDQELAQTIGAPPGTRWLRVRSLRHYPSQPSRPICASDSYVASKFSGIRSQLSDETTALCDLLSTHFGVLLASIEQEIKGATIPHGLAAVLEAKPGDTALSILRRYRDPSGWVFLVTVGLHPADRFAYRMRLERTTSPAEPAGAA